MDTVAVFERHIATLRSKQSRMPGTAQQTPRQKVRFWTLQHEIERIDALARLEAGRQREQVTA